MLLEILKTIWILLPAYTPNNFAVIFGGGFPIDFGKNFVDGRRILGDGKTFRGFFSGLIGGVFVAHLQLFIERAAGFAILSSLPYPQFLQLAFLLSFGSLLGDLTGSFLKRRIGLKRGERAPILDQLDFLVFSLLIASFSEAFWEVFSFENILIAFLITPVLHVVTNRIAYLLKLKDVPW